MATPENVAQGRVLIRNLLVLLIAFNICCLTYYLFVDYKFSFHSDSAAANLLAQEIHESGSYFPREWNYVFGDLWVFFLQTWLVALLPFFPNGYALHAAGAVVGCIATGVATWGVCRAMGLSLQSRLIVLALFSAGFTPSMSEHLYGQQAYGTIYYTSCFVLLASWKYLHSRAKAKWGWGIVTTLLIILVVWPNPQRGLVYYVLPVLAGAFVVCVLQRNRKARFEFKRNGFTTLIPLAAIGTIIGVVAYRTTLLNNTSTGSPIPVQWKAFPEIIHSILRGFQGLVGNVGGFPAAGAPLVNAGSVVSALQMVSGMAIVLLVPYALFRCLRSKNPGHAYIAAAATTSVGISALIYLASSLSVSGSAEDSVRYLVPGLILALLALTAFLFESDNEHKIKKAIGVVAVMILALSASSSFGIRHAPQVLFKKNVEETNPKMKLVHFLESHNARYGYATFWHAGQTTILSDSKVKIRPIQIVNGGLIPMRHLSSNRWYEGSAWNGSSFLLVTKEELKEIDLPRLFNTTGEPVKRTDFENFTLFVFRENIASKIPGWETKVTKPVSYIASSETFHAIGRYSEAERALVAEKEEAGVLRFGPYKSLDRGDYRVTFDIDVEDTGSKNFGLVDVVAKGGHLVLTSTTIENAGRQKLVGKFSLDYFVGDIEFRVFSTGAAKMKFYNVELANDTRN